MSTTIYILRLAGGNWYVGKTNNFQKRMEEHVRGVGSGWTARHKVLRVEKVIENANPFDEDRYVKEYMSKYGIDKVRGGSYVENELSDFQMEALQMEIWAAKDCCTQCGRAGHFVKDCYAKTDVLGNTIEYDNSSEEEYVWECEYCNKTFTTELSTIIHEKSCKLKKSKKPNYSKSDYYSRNECYRCGRSGHYSSNCYASKHVDGYSL